MVHGTVSTAENIYSWLLNLCSLHYTNQTEKIQKWQIKDRLEKSEQWLKHPNIQHILS